jgi:hypothetical protein
MKRVLLLLFVMLHGFANAQNYFSKMYDLFGGWEAAYQVIVYDSSTILFLGDYTNRFDPTVDTPISNAVSLFRIDSIASRVKSKIIYENEFVYFTGLKPFNVGIQSYFIFGKYAYGLNRERVYYLAALDTLNVDTLYTRKLNKLDSAIDIRSSLFYHNKLYLFGFKGYAQGSPFAALCFDTSGKQLWYKVYNDKLVFPTGVAIASDGSFLVSGNLTNGSWPKDTLYAWYAKIDTLGNILWEKKLSEFHESPGGIPIVINGNSYWIGGAPGGPRYKSRKAYSYLFKTDINGNITYYKKIIEGIADDYEFTNLELIYPVYKNGFIYAAGIGSDTLSAQRYNDYILFCKLDTFGNIKWRRTFSQWYMSNRPYSLSAISDGFIICADGKDTTHTTGFTDAWIIKTDTNGCIIPGCHLADAVIEVVDERNYVKVYPNPANTQVTIEFNDPQQTPIDWIELIDEKGISLQSKAVNNQTYTLTTTHLITGTYYLAAYFNGNKRVVKKVLIQHD